MKSHINRPLVTKKTINDLVHSLSTNDPIERHKAHSRLGEIGKPAVKELIKLSAQPEAELRREAASVLGNIQDPSTISPLIHLLNDEAFEVRWRAAESLVKKKRDGVVPLFQELTRKKRLDSVWFLEGVHHILRKLNDEGYLGPPSQKVLEAFDDPIQKIAIPEAAEKALEAFKGIV